MIDQSTEIKKMWDIFRVDPDMVLELRTLWPNGIEGGKPPRTEHFHLEEYYLAKAGQFTFENCALQLNDLGHTIYVMMTPIQHISRRERHV